ncbi:MAG: glycosyltransferase [Pirellulaceae bacterium]
MMAETFKLSVVIPAHNEEAYLPHTLQSLQKCFSAHQGKNSLLDVEWIVVDDDSTDETASIAKSLNANVVQVKLRNIGAVRNAGAAAASGDWLLFVDADTIVPPETFDQMLELMGQDVAGGGALVDVDDRNAGGMPAKFLFLLLATVWQRVGGLAAGCFMFCRREHFESFGGFDENYFAAEEYFFTRQIKCRGRFLLVRHPVITSSRKLKSYRFRDLFWFLFRPLLLGPKALRSRDGLKVLYEGKR